MVKFFGKKICGLKKKRKRKKFSGKKITITETLDSKNKENGLQNRGRRRKNQRLKRKKNVKRFKKNQRPYEIISITREVYEK